MTSFLLCLGLALIGFSPLFPIWPLVALAGFGVVAIACWLKEEGY